ncbi:hypothetical protein A3742_00585 [Oleiphilus sp. HI0071]|uniref:DUF3081 family protein n=3 Tax=unclassified Oleiphilus TaxID=2631174 RepID=UPI0007C241AE|nr:DUF3081 family protein [Oleiphilus sp. HI0079]KZY71025.1 hypothetical protein A3737_11750 [Oleiphilus sp. HI0065]KZY82959.1 hypothetical protein A3742_00585 [Oleiphilus sp. HI0071]KZZ03727.1 hypothetical protein A3744_10435 [Oleiphilus sp. HI0073]KZZ51795.1 hypothetical protein A3760_11705 [Oleiphilus sp. HI0122]KZZ81221.1 hypothetical protein A3767_27985 [Oleiphilus sp. HI0133]
MIMVDLSKYMMDDLKQKIEVRKALKAFELIRQFGEQEGDEYRLYGVSASSDFDGYNLLLKDARVKLHIFFHNKFECDFDSKSALDAFIGKLDALIEHYEAV